MPKEKVTLTLDSERLAALRELIGRSSLSAEIDEALAAHLERLRHFAAVDEWLVELEAADGPLPDDLRAWAGAEFDAWQQSVAAANRRVG